MYGIIVWRSTYKTNLSKLTVLQNKALRAVGGATWQQSSSPIYYKFGILKINDMYIYKINDMYIYELAKLIYKLETKSLPTPISNHFEPLKIITKTNIRS